MERPVSSSLWAAWKALEQPEIRAITSGDGQILR